MRSQFTSYDQLPITLTADHVAAALGISRANALHPAPFRWLSHAPHRQADGRAQRPLSSVDHGQRKQLI